MQQQFLVPQFIDVEDKIIGPITVRQFVLMLVFGLCAFITYKLVLIWLFIVITLVLAVIFGVLAFVKVNGMPFHFFLLNLFQTFKRSRVRVWDKTLSDSILNDLMKAAPQSVMVKRSLSKKFSTVKLSKLSLVVNTGGIYKGEENHLFNNEQLK